MATYLEDFQVDSAEEDLQYRSNNSNDVNALNVISAQTLRTSGDAFEACLDLLRTQLQKADMLKPTPNESIEGDTSARTTMLMLLNDHQRRRLFLHIANDMTNWPRLRPLFGAPPYSFLKSGDALALRAAGFSSRRSNMGYEGQRTSNMYQFGTGQFIDEHSREYRIVTDNDDSAAPLGAEFLETQSQLVLQVRLKRYTISKKRLIAKDSTSIKQLMLPQPGETVQLTETKQMARAVGVSVPRTNTLRVRATFPRGENASTATIVMAR